ncbi:MAG TPA: penicillin-binding protein 2, partial [Chloroflexi bacterium]|nr:penicillin-binding protein 2 [Chloroflexota bacterium]
MELVRPGERRRREESDGDDNRITRRVLLARGTIGLAFVGLGGKLWQMQIAEGNEFRRIARENVIEFQRLKAPRGRILDRAGEPLAENRRSWSVQVTQSRLPDDKDQREHILGVVSQKLALGKSLVIDRTLVPVGSEAAVVNAISKRLEVDSATLIARLTGSDIAMLMLRENLSEQDAAGYAASMIDIPGVRVVNTIDYQLANHPL